jgi:quinol monooxygenase YgiN
VATLKVQAAKAAEFEEAVLELVTEVLEKERGVLVYQCSKLGSSSGSTTENTYQIIEVYSDKAALAAHGKTDYFKASGRRMGPCLAGKPDIKMGSILGGESAAGFEQLMEQLARL